MEINLYRKRKKNPKPTVLDSIQGSKCHCKYISILDTIPYYTQYT